MHSKAEGSVSLFQIPSGIPVFSLYSLLSIVYMEMEQYITVMFMNIY
jgi:hypothetical protein